MSELSASGRVMYFSREPTARGDDIAEYVREWYELHRESAWQRWRYGIPGGAVVDGFMLGLIAEVRRVQRAAQ